jgi:hypothetical protein
VLLVHVIITLGLVLLATWGFWSACRPRPRFVVRIANGVPRVARGKVTQAFLQEIGEVCDRHGVRRGELRGVDEGRRIALVFSGNMPEPCRQQLRNIWNLSGWSAAPGRHRK